MNTKMLHDQRQKYNTNVDETSSFDNELDKKNFSGALLDMLAEVASQTLHSDPSVKMSPVKRPTMKTSDIGCHLSSKKKQRVTCRSRSGDGDTMDLEYLRSLTANHLLKLFSEFDGDEIRRIFTFTCFMEPDQCHKQFSSFGSEGKARQQMKSHLLEHVHQLELKAERGFKFTIESVKVRRRRLAEKLNGSNRRLKIGPKIKVEPTLKLEPSDENDSSLPNKENNSCSVSDNCALVKLHFKTEKVNNHEVVEAYENSNKMGMEMVYVKDVNGSHYNNDIGKDCYTEERSKNNGNVNGIYEEHNYVILSAPSNHTVLPVDMNRKGNWAECNNNQNGYDMQKQHKQDKMKEDSSPSDKSPTADLGKFMMAETLRDMVMVCVMEDDQIQLKQLPCVGQEVDIDTCQPLPYKMIRSDDLPVVQDNRKAEPQEYSEEVIREINCEKSIERDEYIQKKKPKGKAKFIGQSKAEKEMAMHLIETMKRKGNTESLECHICNPPRSFTAPTTLISHYRSHAGIKPYECRICHSVFTRQHSLNYHMLIHSNQTRFTCADCGRKFRHPSHFKEHRRRHTGESPYECSDCMLRFKTRNTYKRHLKTRHGKVLTTSGGLIILSEEEFRRVRTLPRSPHNTTTTTHIKQDLSGKKRSRKGKGRFKVSSKKKRLEPHEVMSEEDEDEIKEDTNFNFDRETYQPSVVAMIACGKNGEENKIITDMGDINHSNNVEAEEILLGKSESEPFQKSFQDIVEEAMRQSNISFKDDPENDKANVVVMDVPVTDTEDLYSSKGDTYDNKQENTQKTDAPTINIKSSWNTVNVNLKLQNKGTARNKSDQKSICKSANKNIVQLRPKSCKKSLILPSTVSFNPLVINAGIHQPQTLSTVIPSNVQTPPFSSSNSSSSSSSSFLPSPYSIDNKKSATTQLDSEVLNIVGSDRLSIISTSSQQATIMLLADDCNSFTTVSNRNYILKDFENNSGEILSAPQL
ncbi:uncharacterized protein [Periplaneta americana]|uniref:uncharacterized protein n=1 Tax=Periplaneta americana TaxID=6978 RepID=UPI0037E80E1E